MFKSKTKKIILQLATTLKEDDIEKYETKLSKKLGMSVVILDARFQIAHIED